MANIGIRKIYVKQAVHMLKQNKFMSVIAILGTALAIMMIMTIIVSEEVKNVNVAPEINRYRTYYADGYTLSDSVKNVRNAWNGSVGYDIVHDYLKDLKTPELVSVYGYGNMQNVKVDTGGKKESVAIGKVRSTDANYWQLFSFSFVKGRAYTQEEFDSGMPYSVICEGEARTLFKGEEPLGKTIELNKKEYQVIGVVKDVSPVFRQANSKLWIPYTSVSGYDKNNSYLVAFLAKTTADYPAIAAEIRNAEKRHGIDKQPEALYVRGPHNHRVFVSDVSGYSPEDVEESIKIMYRKRVVILLILLLVPALNLSGISLSRIKKRTTEIGVRKAFGAKKYVILVQVLYENFITSLIGGALGLILSYVVVFWMRTWLLGLSDDAVIPLATLVSPVTFIAVFLACLIINLLSAGLPAYRASRVSIINSINQNEK